MIAKTLLPVGCLLILCTSAFPQSQTTGRIAGTVKDEKGAVTNWAFQSASPTALARGGWGRETLKAGDQITIEGFQARDGKPYAATRFVTLPDGRKMQANADGIPR